MNFESPLLPVAFLKREKRFLMHGTLPDGTAVVAHCPNTGSLKGVTERTRHIWVRDHGPSTTRSLRYTAEVCELDDGTMVGINTQRTNKLVWEAWEKGFLPELSSATDMRLEATYSAETRFDLGFTHNGVRGWGEVKQTTLAEGPRSMFPDAVTERGLKHLHTLIEVAQAGETALQVYVATRGDVSTFTPADAIHPAYGAALREAVKAGVQVVALGCAVTEHGIGVDRRLEIVI